MNSGVTILVENVKFVAKLKVYLMSLGSWSNFGLIDSTNEHNEWIGDSLNAFETTTKFHHWDSIILLAGIIRRIQSKFTFNDQNQNRFV